MLAAFLVIASAPGQVRLIRNSSGAVLCVGRERYPIYPKEPMQLDGGHLAPSQPMDLQNPTQVYNWVRGGKALDTIDFGKLLAEWLKDDNAWGGHSHANQMRYMAAPHDPGPQISGGGGLFCDPSQCLAMPDHTALGVLEIRSVAGSGQPVEAQFLVRYHTHPLRLDRLQLVSPPQDPELYAARPWLYRWRGHVLFNVRSRLEELGDDGSVKSTWVDLPANTVTQGLAGSRWLIGVHDQGSGADNYTVYATDLLRKKIFALISLHNDYGRNGIELRLDGDPRADSSYLLFGVTQHGTPVIKKFAVHLPDGKRTQLPWDVTNIAGPYAVTDMPERVAVYSAKTGKRL